ncbi:MAG: 23S rRNA (pseudouridine(1915)-N(3))-methyltransferase RlmH [Bacteroidales bacterium]|jgi:23S rRNA (pseudouridine1915-N3)-methyltransferase|nr:23S rRNA (pseudouridine(1915)-N(3))-methyltransferase RlmH [Bacteroidales bacterium]
MKIRFVTVGKTVEQYLVEACSEYEKRIKKYVQFEVVTIRDLKNAAALAFDQVKEQEAKLLEPYMTPNNYRIVLDEHGAEYTSVQFADFVSKKMVSPGKDITFVIGGPYGLHQRILAMADCKMSLSKMTFSHQMVRLIFLEQLYRAFTIMRGEPYHHE